MSNRKPPNGEQRERIRRWLLIYFAMFGREQKPLSRADEFEWLVRTQNAGIKTVDAEIIAMEAGAKEFSRTQKSEDDRIAELKVAPIDLVLQAAKDNMEGFDHARAVAPASTAILAAIDPDISGADDGKEYFSKFKIKILYQQTTILEKLVEASRSLSDVYDFTGIIFDLLRNSPAYEPMVHGKIQRGFFRLKKPLKDRGRPRTCGNEMFQSLVRKVTDVFDIPTGSAARIVQLAMSDVLVRVVGAGNITQRHAFRPSDSAVKSLLESMN